MFDIGLTPVGDLTEEELRRELQVLLPKAVVRANRNAINRTITSTRTFISKAVREDLALKSRTVKDSLSIKKAGYSDNPVGKIDVEPKPLSLKRFGARTTRKGVTVRVRKSEGRKVEKGGFIVDTLGGHVFKRTSKKRLPIRKWMGPSVRIEVDEKREEIQDHLSLIHI